MRSRKRLRADSLRCRVEENDALPRPGWRRSRRASASVGGSSVAMSTAGLTRSTAARACSGVMCRRRARHVGDPVLARRLFDDDQGDPGRGVVAGGDRLRVDPVVLRDRRGAGGQNRRRRARRAWPSPRRSGPRRWPGWRLCRRRRWRSSIRSPSRRRPAPWSTRATRSVLIDAGDEDRPGRGTVPDASSSPAPSVRAARTSQWRSRADRARPFRARARRRRPAGGRRSAPRCRDRRRRGRSSGRTARRDRRARRTRAASATAAVARPASSLRAGRARRARIRATDRGNRQTRRSSPAARRRRAPPPGRCQSSRRAAPGRRACRVGVRMAAPLRVVLPAPVAASASGVGGRRGRRRVSAPPAPRFGAAISP